MKHTYTVIISIKLISVFVIEEEKHKWNEKKQSMFRSLSLLKHIYSLFTDNNFKRSKKPSKVLVLIFAYHYMNDAIWRR